MYSGRLQLTPVNIEDIFLTADFLQINTVKLRCQQLFCKHISPDNCLNVSRFTGKLLTNYTNYFLFNWSPG